MATNLNLMLQIKINDNSEFSIEEENGVFTLNGDKKNVDILKISNNQYSIIKDNRSFEVEVVAQEGKNFKLLINGNEYESSVKDDLDLLLDKMGISASNVVIANDLKSPMPGLVLDIKVKVGQTVAEGEGIIVLEAMKMENVLKAPAEVIIKSISVEKGQNVEKNTILVEFE